jgi:hypothetical protein
MLKTEFEKRDNNDWMEFFDTSHDFDGTVHQGHGID